MFEPERTALATAMLDDLGLLNARERLDLEDIAWVPRALIKNDPSAAEMIRYFGLDRVLPREDEAEN